MDAKIIQIEEEELRTHVPGFWDDAKAAEAQMRKIKELKKRIFYRPLFYDMKTYVVC